MSTPFFAIKAEIGLHRVSCRDTPAVRERELCQWRLSRACSRQISANCFWLPHRQTSSRVLSRCRRAVEGEVIAVVMADEVMCVWK